MPHSSQRSIASFCHCIAILLLGETLVRGAGRFDSVALACASGAMVFVALPLFLPPISIDRRIVHALIALGVAIGFYRLPLIDLFFRYPDSRRLLMPFIVLSAVAAVLSILVLLRRPRAMVGGVFALLLLDMGLMGYFYLNLSTSPHMDVYLVQQLGCDAILHGRDPFAMTFPDIYGPGSGFYPAGAVVNGQVQSGYDYPPLSLLLDLPGVLAGDLRYAHLVAIVLAVALAGYCRRNFAPAVWMLFTPKLFLILENAWIETFAVLMLAAVAWCVAKQKRMLAPIVVGLLLVTKQYLLLAAPAVVLLIPTSWRWRKAARFSTLAAIAGSAVTLPFILWNPSAFLHSMTALYTGAFRPDSISFLPVISKMLGMRLTLLCPLLAAVPPSILIVLWGTRSAASFAAATALICLCVFLFSTQAFVNYYFLAAAALCFSIAVDSHEVNADLKQAAAE
jgi:hypothetical protein